MAMETFCFSMLTSVDMYALNARTPPQFTDLPRSPHLQQAHRANGEVMGKINPY
jgi:hypothetical protein